MKEYFTNQASAANNLSLTWTPDFVYVSTSGNLSYTYGQYKMSFMDLIGAVKEHQGVFTPFGKGKKTIHGNVSGIDPINCEILVFKGESRQIRRNINIEENAM